MIRYDENETTAKKRQISGVFRNIDRMDPNVPRQIAFKEECNPCADDDSGSTIM
jgi:hypothetical protein